MKLAKISGTLGLAALSSIAGPSAMAADPGWYVGGNVGQTRADFDAAAITRGVLGAGFATTSIVDDDRSVGGKLFVGYQINRNFAVEGGYFDLGKPYNFTATTVPAGTLSGEIKATGVNYDLVGILPFTDKFSAFGRAGLTHVHTRDSFARTGAVTVANPSPGKNDISYKFGVGLEYAITRALGLRVEAERYRIHDAVSNKGDVDLFSLGLVYRFGGKTPVVATREAPPAPAPAAAPAPRPAAVTPPPPPAAVSPYSPPPVEREPRKDRN